eukprot:364289-Chlamydomonas_euryale.AAC.9
MLLVPSCSLASRSVSPRLTRRAGTFGRTVQRGGLCAFGRAHARGGGAGGFGRLCAVAAGGACNGHADAACAGGHSAAPGSAAGASPATGAGVPLT